MLLKCSLYWPLVQYFSRQALDNICSFLHTKLSSFNHQIIVIFLLTYLTKMDMGLVLSLYLGTQTLIINVTSDCTKTGMQIVTHHLHSWFHLPQTNISTRFECCRICTSWKPRKDDDRIESRACRWKSSAYSACLRVPAKPLNVISLPTDVYFK